MKIGVDARLLTEPITGIGRYTHEMLKQLIDMGEAFYIYSPSELTHIDWLQNKNVTVRTSLAKGRVARMLWSQTILPYWANHDEVDIFWGTTHRLPRFLDANILKVVTIHDLVWKHAGDTMRPLSRLLESILMPQAVRMADMVIADSKHTQQDVFNAFAKPLEQIKTIYLGVSGLNRQPLEMSLEELGIHGSYILFVGTLEPRKNLKRLILAYSLLPESIRNQYQLVIVGGKGWGNLDLVNEIKASKMTDHVVLTGYVSESVLFHLYSNAYVLAMPSLYEGFGLPIVEAMSCGVPILSANVSSLPEIVGNAGVLVNPLDIDDMMNGLKSLLTDKSLHTYFSQNALEQAKQFDWKIAAHELMRVFKEIYAQNRRI